MELEPGTAQIACDHASFLVWHVTTVTDCDHIGLHTLRTYVAHRLRIRCCPWWPKLRLQSTERTHDLPPDSHSDLLRSNEFVILPLPLPLPYIANLKITRRALNTQSGADGESTINLQLADYGWLWRLWADNLVASLSFLGLHHLHRWWNHQLHTLGVEGIRWPASQNHCQTLSGGANTYIDWSCGCVWWLANARNAFASHLKQQQ